MYLPTAVSIQWTGLLDWTTGMDYWTVFAHAHCVTRDMMQTSTIIRVHVASLEVENG